MRDNGIKASIIKTMPDSINSEPGKRHLTLLIAGLVPLLENGDTDPGLTRLEWLLGRADRVNGTDWKNLDECLFRLFRAEIRPGQDLPVAALTRVLDMGVVDNAWWIRADPVHLVPQRDTLVMAASDDLAIDQREANQLVREILEVFSDDGWVLKAPCPNRWYLQPVDPPDISTTPVDDVVGKNIYPALPDGPDGKKWHTVLNELQILLHTARVNADREAKGQLSINSLWFWGGGRLPAMKESDWRQLWSSEPVGTALARLAQVDHVDRPASAEQWLSDASAGNHVVVLDQALRARVHGRYEDWRNFVDTLEELWIEPLIQGLQHDELEQLSILLDNGHRFDTTAAHLRRWWRRRKALDSVNRRQ